MAVAVGTGEERGVSGGRTSVGVVVVAVRKIGTVIHQETETRVAKLIVVALEIISAELVDDNHDYKLGMSVISGGGDWDRPRDQQYEQQHC